MDFVSGLPNIKKEINAIWNIIDPLMTSAHFIPMKSGNKMHMAPLTELFVNEIVNGTVNQYLSLQTEIADLFRGFGRLYMNPCVPGYSSTRHITYRQMVNLNAPYRLLKTCYVLVY